MNNAKRVEILINSIPYPNQIKDISLEEENAVKFTWRQTIYRFSNDDNIEEVDNGFLVGNDKSILMSALIKKSSMISEVK